MGGILTVGVRVAGVLGGGIIIIVSSRRQRGIIVKHKVNFRGHTNREVGSDKVRGRCTLDDRRLGKQLDRLLDRVPLRIVTAYSHVVSLTRRHLKGLRSDVCVSLASRYRFTVGHFRRGILLPGPLL